MKDLKHLLYFENLLQEAHNDLVAQAQNEGKICVAYACENTPEPSSETSPEEDIKDKPGTAQEKLERLKAEAEEQMEETTPYLSDARTSEEMYKAMISKGRLDNRPEIKWNPIQDRL